MFVKDVLKTGLTKRKVVSLKLTWVFPKIGVSPISLINHPFLGYHYFGNTHIDPENVWLEYDRFLLGFGLFSGAFALSFRESPKKGIFRRRLANVQKGVY